MEEGRHLFDVNRYGLLKDLGVGKCVNSGTFDVGGYGWSIRFYPAGSEAAPAGQHHVSVYLELMTPNVEVRALFDLKLMDQSTGRWHSLFGDGGDRPMRHARFNTTFQTNTLPPHHPPRCWGVPSWKASSLETSVYIHNGGLTIRCDLSVIKPPQTPETKQLPRIEAPPPGPGMTKDFSKLLADKDGKAVTVHVGGEAIRAHWAVLAARSPVLRKKLLDAATTSNETTAPSPFEITLDDDMEPAVFKAMLHFMYTDELPPDAQGHDDDDKTAELARRLFVAAEGCGIERLKRLCESLLYTNLSKRTLRATMEFAERHRCDRLRAACVQFHAARHPPGPVVCNYFSGIKRETSEGDSECSNCKRLKKAHQGAGHSSEAC
jgi:speckle-type POZ protein